MPELTKVQTGFIEPQSPLELDSGTESAPGIHFEGDENTGFYKSAENEVALSIDGTQKYKFSSDGLKLNGPTLDGKIELSAVDKDINDTAVDVFVYDTSKDSDGGAWRKRTQHTSWYNETLNTATRGSRREFPAVAVIVAETDQVTIYDGDDPDLPMWMVFNTTSGTMLRSGAITSASMLNAELCVCHQSGSGFHRIWFLKDTARWLTASTGYGGYYGFVPNSGGTTIAERNTAGGNYLNNIGGASDIVIVSSNCNDVAMTVLPNAPIDDVTGLPVPTIAVGTDGGVSIIKDDGNIYDSSDTNPYGTMEFNGQRLISSRNTNQVRFFISQEMRTIDADGFSLYESYALDTTVGYPKLLIDSGYGLVSKHSDFAARGGSLGVTLWDWDPSNTNAFQDFQTESSIAHISTTYNTGWQFGDCKGAFLSDTDATNITGSNLIDNGDFGTGNFTNWSINGTTTPTISSGGALLTTGAIDGAIWQSTSGEATSGKWNISWTVTSNSGGFFGLFLNNDGPNGSGGSLVYDGWTTSGSYYYEGNITAVEFRHRGASSGIIDNIALVRVGDEDRSANNQGLQVYGTITKSPVAGSGATAAELVAYSGFSQSNYLYQPYNSELAFSATDEWCFMIWADGAADAELTPNSFMFAKGYYDGSNWQEYIDIRIRDNGDINFEIKGTLSGGNFSSSRAIIDNNWHQYVLLKRGSNNYEGYIDGQLVGTQTADRGAFNNAKADLVVGTAQPLQDTQTWDGSLSLFRISKSAPSAEQIKKIYEDEKHLFQENVACTLYGSSDAVTAIAYDEKTELLHVGTSSGRSDFIGLQRINSTTDPVTTAISAHNGSIAQQ